jgi:hypothetical protein
MQTEDLEEAIRREAAKFHASTLRRLESLRIVYIIAAVGVIMLAIVHLSLAVYFDEILLIVHSGILLTFGAVLGVGAWFFRYQVATYRLIGASVLAPRDADGPGGESQDGPGESASADVGREPGGSGLLTAPQ